MRRALARTNELIFDGLNQARVVISTARHIDLFRDQPHAQKVIRCWSQQLEAGLLRGYSLLRTSIMGQAGAAPPSQRAAVSASVRSILRRSAILRRIVFR